MQQIVILKTMLMGFEKLMDEYNVDFVLGGHDHVYSRSYVLKDGQRNSEKIRYT